MIDYYATLQIMPTASDEVVKSAYRALGKKYHPDNKKCPADVCKKKMIEINAAYEILSDPIKRKQYDYEYQQFMATQYSEQKADTCEDREKNHVDETEKVEEPESLMQTLFRGIGSMLQKNKQLIDNAYIEGNSMDDFELVQTFMRSYGYRRRGFSIVMEERELLERNDEGKMIPTEKFKYYWR